MNKVFKIQNFKFITNTFKLSAYRNSFFFTSKKDSDKSHKIYTKTGDKGTTSLIGGIRKYKDDEIFELLGDIDELNSYVGLCSAFLNPKNKKEEKLHQTLQDIQNHLYHISSYIASQENEKYLKDPSFEERLEQGIDTMEETLPPLTHFVNPGGCVAAAHMQVARTISRRVERRYVTYSREKSKTFNKFFNRLSDFFFVSSRYVNHIHKVSDAIAV